MKHPLTVNSTKAKGSLMSSIHRQQSNYSQNSATVKAPPQPTVPQYSQDEISVK